MRTKKSQLNVFAVIGLILASVFVGASVVNESVNQTKNSDGYWVEYEEGVYTNDIPDLDCPAYIYEEYNENTGISKNEFLNLYEYCIQIKKREENKQYTVEQEIQEYLDNCKEERSHDPSPASYCLPENEEEIIEQIREEFDKPKTVRIMHPPSLKKQTQEQFREEFKNYSQENIKNDSWVNRLSNDTFYEDKEISDNILKTALIKIHTFLKSKLSWLFK